MSDTVSALLKAKEMADDNKRKAEAFTEEYRSAINNVVSSPDGQLVFKQLMIFCEALRVEKSLDAAKILTHNAKRDVYMTAIREYLNRENKILLEG